MCALTLPVGTDSGQCQSCDLPSTHLEITFLSLHPQGQGAQLSLTRVLTPPLSLFSTPKRTTNRAWRKGTSYLGRLLFWGGSGNIQDGHIALILKDRGISRHTEGRVGVVQIRRLWHKSHNLACIGEREQETQRTPL